MTETPDTEDAESLALVKDIAGFMGCLVRETERATVILAAARVDVDLEVLLKRVLHPHPGGADSLFDSDRALGTLSAKIDIAYRLGILSRDFEHALQMLRKIRNDFAHTLEHESLSSSRQKPRLNALIKWAEASKLYESPLAILKGEARTQEQAEFVACAICIAVLFKRGLRTLHRVNLGEPLAL
jgi:hypothetical protein